MPRWPRRGRGGRGQRFSNTSPAQRFWGAPESSGLGQVKRPPGLRGKEIGLFYRNLNKNKKKGASFSLTIPPAAIKEVRLHLLSIGKIITQNAITVPNWYVSKFMKQEPILIAHGEAKDPIKSEYESDEGPIKSECEDVVTTKDTIFKKPSVPIKQEAGPSTANMDRSSELDIRFDEEIKHESFSSLEVQPGALKAPDFNPTVKQEPIDSDDDDHRQLSLRSEKDYKYGYFDIISGSFNEKLDECLAKGLAINVSNPDIENLNECFAKEYEVMTQRAEYKKMKEFRVKLPAYNKCKELLDVINNNSVIVISGETGCGKSTQVPQLILDDAIVNRRGAHTKILVTQPRRIAASSLSERVANERAERNGNSVGYAVRLEKIEARPRGSIMFCTTGILLNELEVNQGLGNLSHVVLDEVHERDAHVDLAMVMLKEILKKRKDLKLILMSATLDAASLSAYFDNCPTIHIEGLAYPVQDIYLEDILRFVTFDLNTLPKKESRRDQAYSMERDVQHRADVGEWLQSIRRNVDPNVYRALLDWRIEELQIDLILDVLAHICKGQPGAVLIFVPGIAEITKILRHINESGCYPQSKYEVYPLHSKLPSLEQKRIFEKPPEGVRKIIVSTNIAETSITIDDIVYVIDSGKIKISGLNVEDNVATLKTEWVSQANLRQRRGRAGRCQAGICYHMLTSHRASRLADRLLPDLQRSNLLEPVLMIKKLRMGKAEEALQRVPDPPAESTIKWAIKHLQQIGALDSLETLTPLGWHVARLPVHPAAGKLLLLGALFGCLDRAASVAAVWGFKDPFMMVIGKEKERDRAKLELTRGEPSDHVAISEAIIIWERSACEQRSFAYKYFLSNNTLQLLSQMKQQFGDNLKQMGFLTSGDIKSAWENRNAHNISLFKALVAAALYPNIGIVKWNGLHSSNPRRAITVKVKTSEEGNVAIHPSSVMANVFSKTGFENRPTCNMGANWLVYWLKQKSTSLYLIDVTLVYTLPLLFFGELNVSDEPVENTPDHCYMFLSRFKVKCHRDTADMLFELRSLLDHVLASKVMAGSEHAVRHSEFEERVLNAVIDLITAEDEQADYDDSESDQSDYEDKQRMKWNPRR